jgi:hypothetical protein
MAGKLLFDILRNKYLYTSYVPFVDMLLHIFPQFYITCFGCHFHFKSSRIRKGFVTDRTKMRSVTMILCPNIHN